MPAASQVGTVPYTAPETFATDRISKQTDIYAFGILRAHCACPLHQACCLRLTFSSAGQVVCCICDEDAPSCSST